jgi:hypothetical protein
MRVKLEISTAPSVIVNPLITSNLVRLGSAGILKATIIFIPFAFLILDVSAWWLTRIDPAFAWLVIIGGFGYNIFSVRIHVYIYLPIVTTRPFSLPCK